MERSVSEGGSGRPAEVTYERIGAAAVLTIDRQERRNAVDGPTAERLLEGYRAFEADDDARVLVVTGAGGVSFCAGADLKNIASFAGRLMAEEGPFGFTRLTPSKPTIAAVGGWCLAGGLELALWCDLRIATPGSKLGFPERRWGVPLIDGGTQRLPRIVGMGRALDLILTGRIMEAAEALDWGLVNELHDDPLARALEIAEGLASFPQETMLADRRAAQAGPEVFRVAVQGAGRFAGGEGRGGAGAGV
jgi:enoyl-CoA hydratase